MAITNSSNLTGRALEYAIVNYIIDNIEEINSVGNISIDQVHDKEKFDSLDENQQSFYQESSESIFNWLDINFSIADAANVSVERLSDAAANQGDVTDIRLVFDDEIVDLSKHNHTVLKHQRPPSTAQQCGYSKNSVIDIEYREAYNIIGDFFLSEARKLKSNAVEFSELKAIQHDFIDKNLYSPVCEHVTNFINNHANTGTNAQSYFTFLVGNTDFYKIVVRANDIEIMEFANMPAVDSLTAEQASDSYIHDTFSNRWIISMRFHTASSRLGLSLKFDTQPHHIEVATEKI